MAFIKLPDKLQPFKAALNQGVRKTAEFLSGLFSKVAKGPDIFYKKDGPPGPFGDGPSAGF